jgi:hypothetical protein
MISGADRTDAVTNVLRNLVANPNEVARAQGLLASAMGKV